MTRAVQHMVDISIPYQGDPREHVCPPWPFPSGPELVVQFILQRTLRSETWLLVMENQAGMRGGAAAAEARS